MCCHQSVTLRRTLARRSPRTRFAETARRYSAARSQGGRRTRWAPFVPLRAQRRSTDALEDAESRGKLEAVETDGCMPHSYRPPGGRGMEKRRRCRRSSPCDATAICLPVLLGSTVTRHCTRSTRVCARAWGWSRACGVQRNTRGRDSDSARADGLWASLSARTGPGPGLLDERALRE